MRSLSLLVILVVLSASAWAAQTALSGQSQPVELEFGGYRFGQSPAANMLCFSGYCKSQAPGGDERFTFPFSIYETPGAVSTQVGMTVVDTRYSFWEDQLYRIFFRVDCYPQATEECLEDLTKALDREYRLIPLSANDWRHFVTEGRSIMREYVTEAGALVRIRATSHEGVWQMPNIDIVDKGVADRVGSTLSPAYKSKQLTLPRSLEK